MKTVTAESKPAGSRLKKRIRLPLLVILCTTGWAVASFWDQMGKLDASNSKLKELEITSAQKQQLNDELKREVLRLNNPEYLEQKIGKELHYIKPGETMLYAPKPKTTP